MFASKNKQVVQIQIQVSHVEAVSTRVEFGVEVHYDIQQRTDCSSEFVYPFICDPNTHFDLSCAGSGFYHPKLVFPVRNGKKRD